MRNHYHIGVHVGPDLVSMVYLGCLLSASHPEDELTLRPFQLHPSPEEALAVQMTPGKITVILCYELPDTLDLSQTLWTLPPEALQSITCQSRPHRIDTWMALGKDRSKHHLIAVAEALFAGALPAPAPRPHRLTLCRGNLFQSGCQTLVNPVNCVGVMGKGLALQFKQNFPAMYADYVNRCRKEDVHPGKPYLFKRLSCPTWIVIFPTKGHWRSRSQMKDIEAGLTVLARQCTHWGIRSLAMPAIGTGEGSLAWEPVLKQIKKILFGTPMTIKVYLPQPSTSPTRLGKRSPSHSPMKERKRPKEDIRSFFRR